MFFITNQNKLRIPSQQDFRVQNSSASSIEYLFEKVVSGYNPRITNIELAVSKQG